MSHQQVRSYGDRITACTDPEGGGDRDPDPPPPLKNRVSLLLTLDRIKLPSQHSMFSIISTPAKHHLNGASFAGQWWPAYNCIWILSSLNLTPPPPPPQKKKKNIKVGPLLIQFTDPRMHRVRSHLIYWRSPWSNQWPLVYKVNDLSPTPQLLLYKLTLKGERLISTEQTQIHLY